MNVTAYDAIVVGGGPAGSSCATILARNGRKTLVLEKADFPRPKICGDCIHPKVWPLFDQLGVSEEFRRMPLNIIRRFTITNQTGANVSVDLEENKDKPFFSIMRSDLDDILLRSAAESGAEILVRHELTDVRKEGNGWEVAVRNHNGSTISRFRCQKLIGADGRNSLVARQLRNLGLAQSSLVPHDRCGVQWHTQYQEAIGGSVEMYMFEHGYAGVVNCSHETATIGMVASPEVASLAKKDFPLFLRKTLHANNKARLRIPSCDPNDNVLTASPIQPRRTVIEREGARLIGDARQTVEPFTGQGVLFAMRDGISSGLSIARNSSPSDSANRAIAFPNRIVSPVLQRAYYANALISLGSRFPRFASSLAHGLWVHQG